MARLIATFSIVARDPINGDLGVAVASKFLAVGSVVSWAQAGAGAIATQAWGNIGFGPRGLAHMAAGMSAAETLAALLADDPQREDRQVGVVDARGGVAAHTGQQCYDWAGQVIGAGYSVQGNILAGQQVAAAIAQTFERTSGELAERLTAALVAGDRVGGDRRGRQSAALYVARAGGSYGGLLDRYIDLRVDDHADPTVEIGRLLALHRFYLTPPLPETLIPLDEPTVREIQTLLTTAGFYQAAITGTYDPLTHAALNEYGGIENLEMRLVSQTAIDPLVLQFMRDKIADGAA
jgi:uncharacterized Ntn-hydrolase superfamily protein